ncbi:MAG: hypothetical protein R3B06_00215 [Kofleriaceae bacterium]
MKAAEAAIASGERGALEAMLRKEGIYSSHLSAWRRQLAANGEAGLVARGVSGPSASEEAEQSDIHETPLECP